jgi:EAL domain-containing protein (putative c-di-GMP-specific phosphodiesterase class I)/FixJ family two-component response regulator
MDRLLVIDDEAELGRFVGRVAESMGYEVNVTTRAQDFKTAVDAWAPTAIILDLAMPEADGLELLRWLASENRQMQIMIMSGYDGRIIEAAKRIGQERGLDICCTLTKPIRAEELRKKLESLRKLDAIKKQSKPVELEDLNNGISKGELFLLYQPKVTMHTGMLQGVEALIRWRHPIYGPISPVELSELAGKTGLTDMVSYFVMSEAVHQQKLWAEAGVDIQVAINLSPESLRNPELADHIEGLCQSEKVPPDRIVIEVTENAVMNNSLEMLDILTRLRLKGFKMSIDEFGTGFSSLARLQRLPVTELKIAPSFIAEMLVSADALVIVKTVVSLAQNLNLTCVAEGIETIDQYRTLMDLGCHLGQGYGIAQPMTPAELLQWNAKLDPATTEAETPKPQG